MNIYFIHIFNVLLPLVFISAIASFYIKNIYKIFLTIILGFLFAYFAFFISSKSSQITQLNFFVNIIFVIFLILIFILSIFKSLSIFKILALFIISFAFAIRYYYISWDFPIFTSSLLDNEAVLSISFIILACICSVLIFVFLRWNFLNNKKLNLTFLFIIIICELNKNLANILLTIMRENLVKNYISLREFIHSKNTLSYVSKSLYYGDYSNYLYLFLIFILSFVCFKYYKKNNKKNGIFDIKFRKFSAYNQKIKAYFATSMASILVCFGVILYFDLVSSKPISIDEPKEVEPNDQGLFVFDIKLLRDNKLHRFAYVTDEGKVIRFFLLNKKEDRDLPVAVFDACMICGDMGYVKRGNELICISCNVRIFLLSVGKEGGCNPIPMPYEFDGEKITIKLEDIIVGTNFFTQIKEVKVTDPVSKTKLINLKAEYSYFYNGFTYYFENKTNYEKFKTNPELYIDKNKKAKFMVQGY